VVVKRIATLVASWALIAACSSGSGPSMADVSAAQACSDNAHQRCARLQTCSTTAMQLRYGSESECESRETTDCTKSLSEPLNGNTPTAVEACAGAYAAWDCEDYLANQNVPTACQQQLGPVVHGGACAIDGQCESGFCGVSPGSSCGTCAATPTVDASCAELTSCGPNLVCTADTARCVVPGVRGASCGKGAPCGVGLSCVGASVTTPPQGTCQRAGETVGAGCDPTEKKGAGCDLNAGLACDAATRTCQTVTLASAGAPCGGPAVEHPAYCTGASFCAGASSTKVGACKAAAADGAACNAATGPGCITPARCVGRSGTAGTCQYSGAQSCAP